MVGAVLGEPSRGTEACPVREYPVGTLWVPCEYPSSTRRAEPGDGSLPGACVREYTREAVANDETEPNRREG